MRASRTVLTAGAAIAVLAIALIIGFQLRDRNAAVANPSASPTSSAIAPVVAPSATATATPSAASSAAAPAAGVYNDAFGFVVNEASTTVPTVQTNAPAHTRSESSTVSIAAFSHEGFFVSPDGTQIAYWSPRAPGQSPELRIVRASDPQFLIASSGLSANENGGRVIWANDMSAVAYVVVGPGPATSGTIRTFNTRAGSSGPGQAILQFNEAGKFISPIAWDRSTNMLAVAVSSGSSGFITDYIVADSATPGANAKRTPLNEKITSMTGSSDAKFILAIDAVAVPSYWPLASIGSRVTPARANDPVWRPGTHEFGWVDADKLVLYSADQNATSGGFSDVPAGASIRTFRADGSAVLFAVPGGAQTTYTLVLLGKPDPMPGDRVTFQDSDGLRASIRLR
jgi:hypothetical protein